MIKTHILLACVKTKAPLRCSAEELYTSSLFKKSLAYAKYLEPDTVHILSAKYGLVGLRKIIDPYEKTLKSMKKKERLEWASDVREHLACVSDFETDTFVFLAGIPYRENLTPYLKHVEVPLEGLSFGMQLQKLTTLVG